MIGGRQDQKAPALAEREFASRFETPRSEVRRGQDCASASAKFGGVLAAWGRVWGPGRVGLKPQTVPRSQLARPTQTFGWTAKRSAALRSFYPGSLEQAGP